MLYECKKCNKLTNDIKKYTSKKIGISKNINLLENYIKKNNRKSFSKNNQNKDPRKFPIVTPYEDLITNLFEIIYRTEIELEEIKKNI